jgi:hypothetical protein
MMGYLKFTLDVISDPSAVINSYQQCLNIQQNNHLLVKYLQEIHTRPQHNQHQYGDQHLAQLKIFM